MFVYCLLSVGSVVRLNLKCQPWFPLCFVCVAAGGGRLSVDLSELAKRHRPSRVQWKKYFLLVAQLSDKISHNLLPGNQLDSSILCSESVTINKHFSSLRKCRLTQLEISPEKRNINTGRNDSHIFALSYLKWNFLWNHLHPFRNQNDLPQLSSTKK